MDKTQEQLDNKPWLWKKGQSGNPGGRPKGSKSMKQWAKEVLESMPEEERQEFMHGLPKEIIWKMAEGNPENKTDITTQGEKINTLDPKLLEIAKEAEEKIKKTL
jgi:hypothetical protein